MGSLCQAHRFGLLSRDEIICGARPGQPGGILADDAAKICGACLGRSLCCSHPGFGLCDPRPDLKHVSLRHIAELEQPAHQSQLL